MRVRSTSTPSTRRAPKAATRKVMKPVSIEGYPHEPCPTTRQAIPQKHRLTKLRPKTCLLVGIDLVKTCAFQGLRLVMWGHAVTSQCLSACYDFKAVDPQWICGSLGWLAKTSAAPELHPTSSTTFPVA
jgi:hypothetical protein